MRFYRMVLLLSKHKINMS